MKRLLCCVCLLVACDVSESQPPEASPEPDAAPVSKPAEPPTDPKPEASPEPDAPQPVDAEPERTPKPLSIVDIDPDAGPLGHQLKLHAKRAAKDGQRVVLEMGAPWCPPCKRAKKLLAEDAVKAELEDVVVLRANSDVWGEDLDDLGFNAPVIPVYYLLDGTGAPAGESVRGDRWKSHDQVRKGLLAFLRGV